MSTKFENQHDRAEKLAKRLETYEETKAPEKPRSADTVSVESNEKSPNNPKPVIGNYAKYVALIVCLAVAIGLTINPGTTPTPTAAPKSPAVVKIVSPEPRVVNEIPPGIKATSGESMRMTPYNTLGKAAPTSTYSALHINSWRLDVDTTTNATSGHAPNIQFTSSIEVNDASNATVPLKTDFDLVNVYSGSVTPLEQSNCSITISGTARVGKCTAKLSAPLKAGSYQLRGTIVTSASGTTSASTSSFGAWSR